MISYMGVGAASSPRGAGVGQAAKETGHWQGDSDMFLRGKCTTGTAKYIALVTMGYSSLSHGAKDGVLDS